MAIYSEFSQLKMVIFHSYVTVYQRVAMIKFHCNILFSRTFNIQHAEQLVS